MLAYLRKGETFAEVAAGFDVSTATAWRHVNEVITFLAARAPKLSRALRAAKNTGYAFVVIDGTMIPIDRMAADWPFYSVKHRMHGMNNQVITAPDGTIVWTSGALPGSVHDIKAARIWGCCGEVRSARSGRQGLHRRRPARHHPVRRQNKPESQKTANRSHARLRAPGERGNAQLKGCRILRKLRCCPHRAGHLAKAIHVLQTRKAAG